MLQYVYPPHPGFVPCRGWEDELITRGEGRECVGADDSDVRGVAQEPMEVAVEEGDRFVSPSPGSERERQRDNDNVKLPRQDQHWKQQQRCRGCP